MENISLSAVLGEIRYAIDGVHWIEDGLVPMDNGEVERLIKLIVLGRKNWFFLGSGEAGQRAASVYSLVLNCYRLGMDPWAYFRAVLPKLGDTRFPLCQRSCRLDLEGRHAQLDTHRRCAWKAAQHPGGCGATGWVCVGPLCTSSANKSHDPTSKSPLGCG